jgi:hypothetical protein
MKLPGITTIPKLGSRLGLTLRNYSTATPMNHLYRRISPLGDPKVSIVPVLDQWILEGRTVTKQPLLSIIKELRRFKRYTHALEVSFYDSPFLFLFLFLFFSLLTMCGKAKDFRISNIKKVKQID